ncbi:MAG: hypothetical protein RSE19_13480, partial [Myroides sp.]
LTCRHRLYPYLWQLLKIKEFAMEKTVLEILETIVHTNPYFNDLSEKEKEFKIWSFVQILIHH